VNVGGLGKYLKVVMTHMFVINVGKTTPKSIQKKKMTLIG
jgi:hypothetical protein